MSKEITLPNNGIMPGIGAMDETDNTSLNNFAQLMQKTSKALETVAGAKIGDIIDSEGHKLNGKPFIAVFKFNMFTKFKPADEGGGVEWRTTNCKDQRVIDGMIWEKDKKGNTIKPAVSKSINLVAIYDGNFDKPVIIPFRSTSLKTAQALIKQAITDGSLYHRIYSLDSEKQEAKKYTYQVMTLKIGKPIDKKLLIKANAAYEQHAADYNRMSSFVDEAKTELPGEDIGEDINEEVNKHNGRTF